MYLSVSKHAVSAAEGSRCTTGNILCQQDFGQCRDKIFAPGEVGVSTGTCYKEVSPLFLSSYRLCINRVSLAVIVEESCFESGCSGSEGLLGFSVGG